MIASGVTSTMAARTVTRRSNRLCRATARESRKLMQRSSGESPANDDAPLRATSAPVVTPSPRRKKRTTRTNDMSSTRNRKRKGSKIPSAVRSLSMEDHGLMPLGKLVENNDLELTTEMVAAINPEQGFIDLKVSPEELRPSHTLTNGQCFHWKVIRGLNNISKDETIGQTTVTTSAWGTFDATEWVGTLRLRLFDAYETAIVVIRETPETTLYRPLITTCDLDSSADTSEIHDELHRALLEYFRLDNEKEDGVQLQELYREWSETCSRLATIASCIPGVRILQQDPWECLVSFICSSNNNIPRITKMLASIRKEYGQPLLKVPHLPIPTAYESQAQDITDGYYYQFYTFPSLEELMSKATDKDLREKCGMGYRATYILDTMKILADESKGGEAYLRTLRDVQDPITVQNMLCEFKGVGRKVADCVGLFSLKQDDAIPVDTHVWNIAIRDYDTEGTLKTNVKSLTPSNYKLVGDLFRSRFPNRAGWAHSLLFVAELPSFRGLLPESLVNEMDEFQKEEKERKKRQKDKKKES